MPSFLQSFKAYKDKRLISIFLFGIASGYPWVMISSALSGWLKDEGLSRTAIGLFGLITLSYTINFFWSPLLDRITLPFLGHRRGWILTTQILIVASCIAMALVPVQEHLFLLALAGFMLAAFSATQDIAIDAYRVDTIGNKEGDKLAAASALATAGWWTGFGGLGAIPFFMADMPGWTWPEIYLLLALIMGGLMLTVFFATEPVTEREKMQYDAAQKHKDFWQSKGLEPSLALTFVNWLSVTLVEPFRDFFQRNGAKLALSIIVFIFMFKMGEAFLGRMSIVFYKEIGFSNTDIATYSKLLNWWVTIFFAILGGAVNVRFGIYRGLMVAGIAMASSNLLFALIAQVGPDKLLFVITIFVDGFTAAWGSVALVAFISLLCNKAFSASQYALMASLGVLGRTSVASTSGILVDWMEGNWAGFFILTALMVIPSLIFLRILRDHVNRLEKQHRQ